jgi:hypothetical protein
MRGSRGSDGLETEARFVGDTARERQADTQVGARQDIDDEIARVPQD